MKKRFTTILLTFLLIFNIFGFTAFAAEKTQIVGGDSSLGTSITITYENENYNFTRKNENAKWHSENGFAELNLGRDGSVEILITTADGTQYEATLGKKSNGIGNDKDNENGTDHYALSNIKLKTSNSDSEDFDDKENEPPITPPPPTDDKDEPIIPPPPPTDDEEDPIIPSPPTEEEEDEPIIPPSPPAEEEEDEPIVPPAPPTEDEKEDDVVVPPSNNEDDDEEKEPSDVIEDNNNPPAPPVKEDEEIIIPPSKPGITDTPTLTPETIKPVIPPAKEEIDEIIEEEVIILDKEASFSELPQTGFNFYVFIPIIIIGVMILIDLIKKNKKNEKA